MNSKRMMLAMAVMAGVTLWALSGALAQPKATKARPTAAAVVDVEAVFNALKEKVQIEADLQTKADRLKDEQEKKKTELRQLQSDLDILAPGTPAYDAKQEDLEKRATDLQAWAAFQTQKLNRERGLQIEKLYRKMLEGIGKVAKENGYDLVLFKETDPKFRTDKPEQLSALIQVRKVLWSAEDMDLTDQVMQRMNNDFTNVKK